MTDITLTPQLRIVNPASFHTSDSYTISGQTNVLAVVPIDGVSLQDVLHHGKREVGLGKDANISAARLNEHQSELKIDTSRKYFRSESQQKREHKFALLDYARLLLRKYFVDSKRTGNPHRTRYCLATRIKSDKFVGITLNENEERSAAGLDNLQTCGSICSCPVCAERLMLEHAETVQKALIWAENTGKLPVLVSLTASHHVGMKLADFRDQFKAAWRMFSNHRVWRKYKQTFGIEHWIAAREATRKAIKDNGWHYHMHILLFVDKAKLLDVANPGDMNEKFTNFWLDCLAAAGLSGTEERACDVRSGAKVGSEYLTKIGLTVSAKGQLEYELTGSANKGYTVWDILWDAMQGDIESERMYADYVRVMQGDNWITKSHGLGDLLEEIELPESAETQTDKRTLWMYILPEDWKLVVSKYRVHGVLRVAALYRDERKVLEYIQGLRE